MNIIVVDDLEPVALTYKAILVRAGHDVQAFTRPAEAIQHLKTNGSKYDMVITDIYMNETNGLDVIETAKAVNPAMKTLCITGGGGYDQDTSLMQKARYAADYMAFKPIHSTQLVNMVTNLLREVPQRVSAA